MAAEFKTPFPWFGDKARAADLIWPRFGDVMNYSEPFAGSLAVLLRRPHPPGNEIANDLNAYVANAWRAMQADPGAVARFADYPVNEVDLHARHRWLRADDVYGDLSRGVSEHVRIWAIENGNNPLLRIALCGYEGEHAMPKDWECVEWKASGGYGNRREDNENASRERIWFSPHCIKPEPDLFQAGLLA